MFLKGLIVVALLVACQADKHDYSSKSIVRHEVHHEVKHPEPKKKVEVHKVEVKKVEPVKKEAKPVAHYVSKYHEEKKPAISSQSIVRHEVHHEVKHHEPEKKVEVHKVEVKKVEPVKKEVKPVAHHVSEHHEEKKPAISSQHIVRHDVPAKAPKDFYEHHGPAKYEFEYKVSDPHTGDKKFQHEKRDGHHVKGVYGLHEADGSIRTVDYESDKHVGFTANVKQTTKHIEGHKHHH